MHSHKELSPCPMKIGEKGALMSFTPESNYGYTQRLIILIL
nr:MAG TPA: hypothetical protein [Caudoviricetes sp.]